MQYREPRRPCDFPVRIERPGPDGPVVSDVMLRDLTAAGARLTGLPVLERGAAVSILLRGAPLGATIRWSRSGASGLRFDCPLTPRQMDLLRRHDRFGQRPAARRLHGFRELR